MRRTESNLDNEDEDDDDDTECERDLPRCSLSPNIQDPDDVTPPMSGSPSPRPETSSPSQHHESSFLRDTSSPARPRSTALRHARGTNRGRRGRKAATTEDFGQALNFFINEARQQREPFAAYTSSLIPHLQNIPMERLPYFKIDLMRLMAAYAEGWPMPYTPTMRPVPSNTIPSSPHPPPIPSYQRSGEGYNQYPPYAGFQRNPYNISQPQNMFPLQQQQPLLPNPPPPNVEEHLDHSGASYANL